MAASQKNDHLRADFELSAAIQITIPSELGFGVIQLNEALGVVNVSGELKGSAVDFHAAGCFEFMG